MKRIRRAGIMAAGRGHRLVGPNESKAMFTVCDRPLIDYGLSNLHAIGVEHIVVIARPDDCALHNYLKSQVQFSVVDIIQKDTRAALESFILLNEVLAGDNYYVVSCDVIAEEEDFKRFAIFSAKQIDNVDMTLLVSTHVHDDPECVNDFETPRVNN
jgi:dTDP-glucose pyrophosphorylase